MPTTRGWLTVATGAGCWAAGRIFGTTALEQIGFALLVLVVVAATIVNSTRHDLEVRRTIAPERASAGQIVRVSLDVVNRGRGAAPLMLLDDRAPLELAAHTRFAINGIEPGGTRETGYSLRPPRRGRFELGPLAINFVDPFGLALTRWILAESTSFLVHPRIEHLGLPRDLGEQRSMAVSELRQLTGSRGEEFYTLREYVEGDDLRKIHWPSTAKRGRPMIRQEETPWHTRATIVYDDRAESHDAIGGASSFERCIEAGASLVALYNRSGYTYRLTGAHNPGLRASRGSDHFQRCLDLLALAGTASSKSSQDALAVRLAELEMGTSTEGILVVAAASLSAPIAAGITRCRRRFRHIVTIVFPGHRFSDIATRSRWDGEQRLREAVQLLARSGVRTVVLGPDESLAPAWTSLAVKGRREAAHVGL